MQKFDMGAAWDDAKRLLGAHSGMVWAVAGVFVFLPQLILGLLLPQPPQMSQSGATEAEVALMMDWLRGALPYLLLMSLAAVAGTIAIMRLWLARTSISVSEALRVGLALVPTMLVAQILTGLAAGFAMILLIFPGLYLYARFIAIGPVAADLKIYNPFKLIECSWRLTRGRGLSILLYLVLVLVAAVIVYLLLSTVAALIFGYIPGVGPTLVQFIGAALATILNVFLLAIATSIYRQLVAIGGDAIYRTE